MALTTAEEKRLTEAEYAINQLAQLVKGAGSTNKLNRLLILCQDELRKLNNRLDDIEDKAEELIVLARKLQ